MFSSPYPGPGILQAIASFLKDLPSQRLLMAFARFQRATWSRPPRNLPRGILEPNKQYAVEIVQKDEARRGPNDWRAFFGGRH